MKSNVTWRLANPFGIWRSAAPYDTSQESPADPWNTGRVNDILFDEGGLSFTVAADNGGIWRASSTLGVAVGDNWNHAHFRTLCRGSDGADHIYAGGEGLWETDLGQGFPLVNWRRIDSLANHFPEVGTIFRLQVLRQARVIVVAAAGGLFYAQIPPPPTSGKPWVDSYRWRRAERDAGIEDGGFSDLALGSFVSLPRAEGFADLIAAGVSTGVVDGGFKNYAGGTGPHGLFLASWRDPKTLIIHRAKITHRGDDISPLLGTVGDASVASCESNRQRAYAVAAFSFESDDNLFGIARSFNGGHNWELLDATAEDPSHPGKRVPIRDAAGDQGMYNQSIAVSQTDPDCVAFGFNQPWLSWDGALTWVAPSTDLKGSLSDHLHEDVHRVAFADTTRFGPQQIPGVPQRVWSCSDGGAAEISWGQGAWLIATDYTSDGQHADLFAVVLEGNSLQLYIRRSDDLGAWHAVKAPITTRATGPGCIIQSDFKSSDGANSDNGNFEVLALEGSNLVHYWAHWQGGSFIWTSAGVITSNASGPGCLIQSSYRDGDHGHFEVVVPEGNTLVHYSKNNSNPHNPWGRTGVVTTDAIGQGCIIQSDPKFGQVDPNFEVVVQTTAGLAHFWRDNSGSPWPWVGPNLITDEATGPACLYMADYLSGDGHRNLELVVPQGDQLFHWWRDGNAPGLPWIRSAPVTAPGRKASGPGCLIQSNFGSDDVHGNFEVLACEGGRIFHYWRDNGSSGLPWRPGVLISPLAFSYRSDFNRRLAILEFNRPHDVTGVSPGYGTFTPCAAVPGLVAGGTQDNGVVYCSDMASGSGPWERHIGGDGGAAVFLAAKSLGQQPLAATGRTLIDYMIWLNEKHDPGAAGAGLWNSQQITPGSTIPLASVDPAETPPPVLTEGLKIPRVSAVVMPRDGRRDTVIAVGSKDADIYVLKLNRDFVTIPDTGGQLPAGWVFVATIPNWILSTGDAPTITAVASFDGRTIICGASPPGATANDGGHEFFEVDALTGNVTKMDQDFTGGVSGIGSIAAVNKSLFVATSEFGNVFFTDRGIDGQLVWQQMPSRPIDGLLTAIAADPTTAPATFFVAGESTVFVSNDFGKSWLPASSGLPTPIHCCDLHWVDDGAGQHLYLSTYGRSAWVADKREIWVSNS